ncbi:hypothetical protein RS694_11625 [Rhodoferax saidenbachensis]|uniref:Curli production assembly/transport component CsgG n=1 Tax=Rhodoferax saidenbachensis TaxID=1484693 RepID=A0A1P8KAU6_9BURK|nr:hypothetical protein RS694_11625 [Rhodoferax saidenbachensis]
MSNSLKYLLVLLVATLATGCSTTTTLKPEQTSRIQKVGVISLLPDTLIYQKIGITVFNNERVEKPVATNLNDAGRAGAESAFRGAKRQVKQLDVNVTEVRNLFKPGVIVFSWPPEKAKALLVQLAKQHDLDSIAIVGEVFDGDNGYAGVRYFLRGGFNSIENHGIRADTEVTLYDAKGEVLISRSSGLGEQYPVLRPDGKPWASKIEDNLDAATQAQVLSSMKSVISTKTVSQIQAMGL